MVDVTVVHESFKGVIAALLLLGPTITVNNQKLVPMMVDYGDLWGSSDDCLI
jgi:hypothetical protein